MVDNPCDCGMYTQRTASPQAKPAVIPCNKAGVLGRRLIENILRDHEKNITRGAIKPLLAGLTSIVQFLTKISKAER